MSRSYELDANAAKKADDKASRIDATGEYNGSFKLAIARKSPSKGTEGVELHFEDRSKQDTRITLWTHKGDGTPLSGFNALQAILTCLSLRGIRAETRKVELYDTKAKAKTMQEVDVYPDLMGKPIGLLLQLAPEEYISRQDQTIKVANKLELYSVFHPDSRMVATEILSRAPKAEKLDKMKSSLKDRPVKKLQGSASQPVTSGNEPASTGSFDDFEDDIPF